MDDYSTYHSDHFIMNSGSAEDPTWVFEYWSLGVCVCERNGEGDNELPKVQEKTSPKGTKKIVPIQLTKK